MRSSIATRRSEGRAAPWTADETELSVGMRHYRVLAGDKPLPFGEVVSLWRTSDAFRSFSTRLFANTPFKAFRWETPPVSHASIRREFEFVVLDAPSLSHRAEAGPFLPRLDEDRQSDLIHTFANLGGDATLIVPHRLPMTPLDVYAHLAAFVRGADMIQIHALWSCLGDTIATRLSETPIWLNTAGDAVAWLHIRLDSRPKYYCYRPYASGAPLPHRPLV